MISEHDKKVTAYHEAGHAIVGHVLPHADPVHKVTIISRGNGGGFTWSLPEEDRMLQSESEFKDDLAMMLGGRAAEKLVFKEITTGASNDLQRANQLARSMVMDYGMSDRLPNQVFSHQHDSIFVGRDLGEGKNYSPEVAKVIDDEVAQLINNATEKADEIVHKYRDKLDLIAEHLIKEETIDEDEFIKLIGVRPNKRPTV